MADKSLDLKEKINADLAGNADTATKLKNSVKIQLSGAVSGSANFDGSQGITINATQNFVLSGTTEPTSAQGKNGDIYILLDS